MVMRLKMKIPKNKNFILYSVGQLISRLGDVMAYMSLSWWVLQKSGSGAKFAMLLVPVAAIQIFLQPLMGPFVDRYSRKKIMIISDVFRMVTSVIAFLMIYFDYYNLEALILLASVGAVFTASFEASVAGLTRFLVEDHEVQEALRVNQVLSGFKSFLNPAIAGTLLGFYGPAVCTILNVLSYLFTLVCNGLLELKCPPIKTYKFSAKVILKDWWTDLTSGLRLILNTKMIFYSLLLMGGFQFLFSHLSITLPILILKERLLAPWILGFSESALGLGGIFGALSMGLSTQYLPGRRLWIASFLVAGLSIFFLGFSSYFILSVLGLAIMMVFHTWLSLHFQTRVTLAIPKEFQGRVFSFMSVLISGALPLGFAVSGPLVEKYSASGVISVSGLLCVGLIPMIFFIPLLDQFLLAPHDQIPAFIEKHYPKAFTQP